MKLKSFSNALFMTLLLLGVSSTAAGREPPVAKMVQIEGEVAYTRNGTSWRPIRRTKYLFSGFQIKTGADGGGKLINQETGMAQELGPNSEIKIEGGQIALVSGSLTEPKQESASIFEGLSNKFAKAQRYTTVRRGSGHGEDTSCNNKVRTVRDVTVSPSHPDLVWRNACPEFSYKLVINDESFEIPAQSTAEMIRFSVADVPPGEHSYRVEVMDNEGTVFIPRKDSSFTMLDGKKEKQIMKMLKKAGDDVFVQSGILESENMFVASMDNYRTYFAENPDDNDMRPLLIQAYQDLKLDNLRKSEARLYNASLEEDI